MEFIFNPEHIEKKSFEIIGELLTGKTIEHSNLSVVKRVIHTTADFDYAENLTFSKDAVQLAKDALKNNANIVTDTQMAKAGISKKSVSALNCTVSCYIDNDEVAASAKEQGVTRAGVAVEYAVSKLKNPLIFAVGNAPTALIKLHELITQRGLRPALIIAAPVGFVNVVESKELIMELHTPYIVAQGRKGGSNVAAAICNALLYELFRSE